MRTMFVAILLVFSAVRADAQRVCRKGCACGGACISCSKTCRVGGGSAVDIEPRTPPAPATPAPTRAILAAPSKDSGAKSSDPYRGRWFGSTANRFYFRDGCPIERLLAVGDQVVLPDSASAEAVGYRRLHLPRC